MLRVTHNGMDVKFCNSYSEIKDVVEEILKNHSDLQPQLIHKARLDKNTLYLCYRYRTLYSEMFMIEKVE